MPFIGSLGKSYFRVLVIVNNAAVNIGVQLSRGDPVFIVLNINLEVGVARSYCDFILDFLSGPPLPFSTLVVPFLHAYQQCTRGGFQFLHVFANTLFFCVRTALMGKEVVSHCDLYCPND